MISQCCGAPVDEDVMICSDCKEHLGDEDVDRDEDEEIELSKQLKEKDNASTQTTNSKKSL